MGIDIIRISDIDFYSEGVSLLNTIISNNGNFILIKLDNVGIGELCYTRHEPLYNKNITYIKMEQENLREGLNLTAILATDLNIEVVKGFINIISDMIGKVRYSKAGNEQCNSIYKMLDDIQNKRTPVKFSKDRKIVTFNPYNSVVMSLNANSEYFISTTDVYGDACLDIKRLILSDKHDAAKDIVYIDGSDEIIG